MPIPINNGVGSMPKPTAPPEQHAGTSTRPALETGHIEGTARNPEPYGAEPGAGTRTELLTDHQGRPTLEPMPYDNRPRRSPRPSWADNVTRVFAWFGGEHASYDPQPSGLPDSVQPAGATAGRRNTFRTPPAPWDSGVYVTPRLDADDGEVRR